MRDETTRSTELRAAVVLDLHAALAADGGPDQLLDFAARSARRHLQADAVLEHRGTDEPIRAATSGAAGRCVGADGPVPLHLAGTEGEDPASAALRSGHPVVVTVGQDGPYGAWRARLAEHGYVSAALAARGLAAGGWLAVTLLATTTRDWQADEDRLRVLVDETARCAEVLLRVRAVTRTNEDLRASLASRATIDQALGVIMVQRRCTEREAFDVLRRASRQRELKVRDVAAAMLAELTGRPVEAARPFRERSA